MDFTPRQIQILFLLLNNDTAISSAQLAEELGISKRTVFREMNHVDRDLKPFQLTLQRNSHSGFTLEGTQEDKNVLLHHLENSDSFDPRNKTERQSKLLLALIIKENRLQKIYYYADLLYVSESTISNDLEELSRMLMPYQITLIRKAGFGIRLLYEEENLRTAIVSLSFSLKEYFIQSEVRTFLRGVCEKEDHTHLFQRLTLSARSHFLDYLSVSVFRMQQQYYIEDTTQNDHSNLD